MNVGLELAKLAAQFFGALVVARLAVGWALRRYKTEKTWERRLAAAVTDARAEAESCFWWEWRTVGGDRLLSSEPTDECRRE